MKSIIALLLSLLSISSLAQSPTEPTVYIPVVVHVIESGQPTPSNEDILAKIDLLNKVFDGSAPFLSNPLNIGIQFRLAKLSPQCAPTNGVKRHDYTTKSLLYLYYGVQHETKKGLPEIVLKKETQWDVNQYMNIWIVDKIDSLNTGAFTYLPEEAGSRDGIVITSKDFSESNSPILINQVGRFFNLLNVWENKSPYSNCGDDEVDDTDPVEFYSGQPRTGINPCTNTSFKDATEKNFMSFNDVRTLFTMEQKKRMIKSLKLNNRKSLVNSITDEISSCLFNSSNTADVFKHNDLPVNSFKTLGVGKGGYIYAGTANQGLYKFNGKVWSKLSILSNNSGSNNINDIQTDKNGGIWIAQYGHSFTQAITGGINYLPDSTEIGHIYYTPSTYGLPTRNCRGLFIDTSSTQTTHRIWSAHSGQTGTTEAAGAIGLGVFSAAPAFNIITGGIDQTLPNIGVQSIGGDDTEVWAFAPNNFGNNEILVYDAKTTAYKKKYGIVNIGHSFPANFLVKSIHFDVFAKKNLLIDRRWLGVSNGGLLIFQKNTNQTEGLWYYFNQETFPTKFPSGAIINNNSITSDDSGYVYMGTNQGLVVFTGGEIADSSNYQRFTMAHGLPSNNILDIVSSPYYNRMVIATDQGIVFWDKSRIRKNPEKINITDISEDFNQSHYIVPKESIVHHYLSIKNNLTGKPKKDCYILYTLSNQPPLTFFASELSDDKGLSDLKIPIGGSNPYSPNDDLITSGESNVTVNFFDIVDINNDNIEVETNYFKNTSFKISVIDKAKPISKEMGMGASFEAGGGIIGGGEFEVVNWKLKGSLFSVNGAYIAKPSITVNEDEDNPHIWHTRLRYPNGIKLEGNLGPKVEGQLGKVKVEGGAELELTASGSYVEEYEYALNLQNQADRFFLGNALFGISLTPYSLLMQAYLRNLNLFFQEADAIKTGINLNIENAIEGGLTFVHETDFKEWLDPKIGIEYGPKLFSTDIEISSENLNNDVISHDLVASASIAKNVGTLVGILPNEAIEPGLWSYFLNKIDTSPKTFTVALNRKSNRNTESLISTSASFSDSKDVIIQNEKYTLTYKNKFNYRNDAVESIGIIPVNFISGFFNNQNVWTSPFTMAASSAAGFGGPVSQIKTYHKSIFVKPQGTFGTKAIETNIEKEYKKSNETIALSFALKSILGVDFELSYSDWNSYTHKHKDFVYSSEYHKMLPTVDMPEIETNSPLASSVFQSKANGNIELPDQNPIEGFIQNLITELETLPTSIIENALSFIKQFSQFVGTSNISFSNTQNGTTQRLGLDAKPVNSKGVTTTSAPSIFTFNVLGGNAAFDTGNEVLFKYYYPENQLEAKIGTNTYRIVTDVFFLNARNGTTNLVSAPNGNFTLTTQFSSYELELAGLPTTLIPKVLFQANGTNTWEVVGNANETINFNRLGVFAIGVDLQEDFIPPTISVTPPVSFVDGQNFQFTLTDNLSGIDWSKTYFICNGTVMPYQRVGTSSTINIPIASLHVSGTPLPETFSIQIRTIDLSYNQKSFSQTYPCAKSIKLLSVLGSESVLPNKQQALETIEAQGFAATRPPLELKAGKSILLKPGFEVLPQNSGYFKAEIGGCNTSGAPAQPANFTASTATVCKGQAGVVYAVPTVSGVTYNWSYSGTGATINGTGNSITINFAANATAGTLSVTAANGAGTSPALTLAITANTPPAPPTAPNINSATGATASVLASGCTTYKWYDQATNGTLLFTGNPFISPILNANATYHVACADAPCAETTRTAVTVSVGAVPAQPAAISGTNVACQGRSGLNYSVPAVSGATSYTWTYSGTGAAITGNTRQVVIDYAYAATSGNLNVVANNAFGSSAPRTMAISISPAPPAPTATGVTISSGNSANLTATGCSIYKWYPQASGGTAFTGQNFTTPTLNSTTTYYVACNPGTSCESSRVPVVVTVQ
ncbi:Ig-like domain-containing protein [Runella rosea]|nr:M43 family zinc metalloprotease [Runella rosea]